MKHAEPGDRMAAVGGATPREAGSHGGKGGGKAVLVVFGFAVLLGLGIYIYAHRDMGDIEEAKRQGFALVQAIEGFRNANGVYPDSLPQLVPAQLARIEPPAWGLRWEYRRREQPAGFQLMVPANENRFPLLFYDHVTGTWTLNQ